MSRPGDKLIRKIYPKDEESSPVDTSAGNPPFTAAVVSAIQAAETIKVLLGKEDVLYNKLLMIDLSEHSYETIEF